MNSARASETFLAAMRMAVTGVSVVTTDGAAGRCGIPVSSVSSVSAEPPLVLTCINRKSPATEAIDANLQFCVNMLACSQREYAATFSGRPESGLPFAFDEEKWSTGRTGLPILEGALAVFECELDTYHDAGSHRIFIGRVVAAGRNSAEPLIYCNRAFRSLSNMEISA